VFHDILTNFILLQIGNLTFHTKPVKQDFAAPPLLSAAASQTFFQHSSASRNDTRPVTVASSTPSRDSSVRSIPAQIPAIRNYPRCLPTCKTNRLHSVATQPVLQQARYYPSPNGAILPILDHPPQIPPGKVAETNLDFLQCVCSKGSRLVSVSIGKMNLNRHSCT
jgi:hypothetical protein